MVDEEKIILMSKLAVYDKKYGEKDRKANEYFLNDFVYLKNFWNRFFALIATLIILGSILLYKLLSGELKFSTMDFKQEIVQIVLILIAIMIIYTIIGAKRGVKDYENSKKRLKIYFSNLQKLDRLKDNVEMETEEASNHGADVVYTRNMH